MEVYNIYGSINGPIKMKTKIMQIQYCMLENLIIPQGVTFYARVWLLHALKSSLVWVDKDGVVLKHCPHLWKNVWHFLLHCPTFSLVFSPCPPLSLKFFLILMVLGFWIFAKLHSRPEKWVFEHRWAIFTKFGEIPQTVALFERP